MKIKRCPFCGRKANLIQNYNKNLNAYFVYVECEVCGAKGKASSSKIDVRSDNLEENKACNRALASWNNRIPMLVLKNWSHMWGRELNEYKKDYIMMSDLDYIVENIYEDNEESEYVYSDIVKLT